MGAVEVVPLDAVAPVELPGGSWSRMLLTGGGACLGYSVFKPGTVTGAVKHEVEEVVYVVSGRGEIRLDDGAVPFAAGEAVRIAPGFWHAVANTGDEDCAMVFGFPYPEYPPTERR